MKKFLFGTLTIVLVFCLSTEQALSSDPEIEFDPEIHCLENISVKDEKDLKLVFADIYSNAFENEAFRCLCFNSTVSVEVGHIVINNEYEKPLILYGLSIETNKESGNFLIQTMGDGIIFKKIKVHYDDYLYGKGYKGEKGVRFNGSENKIIDSEIYGFKHSLVLNGDNNLVDGGKFSRVEISGYGNQVKNSLIEGSSITADCRWTGLDEPPEGPFCIIGPYNEIIDSNFGVTIPDTSERVTVTRNNIPADNKNERIYYSGEHDFNHDPPVLHNLGINNVDSHEEDGGFRIVGSFAGEDTVDPTHDRIELFKAKGDESGFLKTCDILQNENSSMEVTDTDGDVKSIIPSGGYYCDCGVVDIESFDYISITYTDSQGNTSLYSEPTTLQFDPVFHCMDSAEKIKEDFSPNVPWTDLSELFESIEDYVYEFEHKRVACFPTNESLYWGTVPDTYYYYFNGSDSLHLNNSSDKRLVLYGLSIQGRWWDEGDEEVLLTVSGHDVDLIEPDIFRKEDEKMPVGIRLTGNGHGITNGKIESADTCVIMEGYDHKIQGTELKWCNTGVYADCAWADQPFAVENAAWILGSSCVIGPDNYFKNMGYYGVYLPGTAQNVTVTRNAMHLNLVDMDKINPNDYWGNLKIFLSRGANDNIQRIDVKKTGLVDPDSNCDPLWYENPQKECSVMGIIDESYCVSPSKIELFKRVEMNGSLNHVIPSGVCSKTYYNDEAIKLTSWWDDDESKYVYTNPGDCVFECMLDSNGAAGVYAFTLTDSLGNTSKYSQVVGYGNPYRPDVALPSTFVSSPSETEADEEYSEEDEKFVTPDDYQDQEQGDLGDDSGESEGDDDIVAANNMLAMGFGCSLADDATRDNGLLYYLPLLMAILCLGIFRKRCIIS